MAYIGKFWDYTENWNIHFLIYNSIPPWIINVNQCRFFVNISKTV